MTTFPLTDPHPDFAGLQRVILGQEQPDRVRFVELKVDDEIMQWVTEHLLGRAWVNFEADPEGHIRQLIEFNYRMGYDFVRNRTPWALLGRPQQGGERTQDTAGLSRGQREWVVGGGGLIRSWDDLRAIRWDDLRPNLPLFDMFARNLHPGMNVMLSGRLFEEVMEVLLGYEGLFVLSHDQPDLVRAVFDTWGEKLYDFYAATLVRPEVGGIFHGDDLGHKTGTMMSPAFLREHVFPWLKRYVDLAHGHDKLFLLHSCGNLLEIMDELMDQVGIDGYHSFQDVILPVQEFQRRYGARVAVLGGVDVDRLARLRPAELRRYCRRILDECMPRGRYVFGSGNSVTNYVPPENYLAMLEEGWRWEGSEAAQRVTE